MAKIKFRYDMGELMLDVETDDGAESYVVDQEELFEELDRQWGCGRLVTQSACDATEVESMRSAIKALGDVIVT